MKISNLPLILMTLTLFACGSSSETGSDPKPTPDPDSRASIDVFGNDKTTIYAGQEQVLDAILPEGSTGDLTYTWVVTDATNTVVTDAITGGDDGKPTFTAPEVAADTTYTITVTIRETGKDPVVRMFETTVISDKADLLATFSASKSNNNDGQHHSTQKITLDARSSRLNSDADSSDGLNFAWTLTVPAGSASTAALDNAAAVTPSFTPDVAGEYTVSLTISDTENNTKTHSQTFEVIDAPIAPAVTLKVDGDSAAEVYAGNSITFIATASGTDAESATYTWQVGGIEVDGETAASYSHTAANDAAGGTTYMVTVRAIVAEQEVSASETLTILKVATAKIEPTSGGAAEIYTDGSIALSASSTSASDTQTLYYTWKAEKVLADGNYEDITNAVVPDVTGGETATFTAPTGDDSSQYRITVTAASTEQQGSQSDAATLNINVIDDSEIRALLSSTQNSQTNGAAVEFKRYSLIIFDASSSKLNSTADTFYGLTFSDWKLEKKQDGQDPADLSTDFSELLTDPHASAKRTFTPTLPGEYTVTVTVSETDADPVNEKMISDTFTVINQAPTVGDIAIVDSLSAQLNPTDTRIMEVAASDADITAATQGSFDVVDVLAYSWKASDDSAITFTAVDGHPNQIAVTAADSVTAPIAVTVTVTVSDGQGKEAKKSIVLTIVAPITAFFTASAPSSHDDYYSNQKITLDASSSSLGTSHTGLSFAWTLTVPADSASTAALDDAAAVNPSFTPDVLGEYTVALTVSETGNPDNSKTADPQTFTVIEAPAAPEITASFIVSAPSSHDGGYYSNQKITLDASSSSLGTSHTGLSFAWTLTVPADSASTAALDDAAAMNPSFTPDVPGEYTVALTVSETSNPDNKKTAAPQTFTVIEAPAAPEITASFIASAPSSHDDYYSNQRITLDASSSSLGTSHTGLSFAWTLTVPAGSASTAALDNAAAMNPSFTPDVPGDYKVALTVSETGNPDNSKTAAPQTFTVIEAPAAPEITAFFNASAPSSHDGGYYSNQKITLDASSSSLGTSHTGLSFAWTLTVPAGSASTAALDNAAAMNPSFTPDVPGDYTVALTVSETSNPDNKKTAAPQTFTVIEAPAAPEITASFIASAPSSHDDYYSNQRITLDASSSSLGTSHTGLSFAWTLTVPAGSASTAALDNAAAMNPSFTPDVPGDYTVALTVSETSNPDNKKTAAPQTFTVIEAPAAPEITASFIASAPSSHDDYYSNQRITLDASSSSLGTSHTGLSFAWTLTVPAGSASTAALDNAAAMNPSFTPDVPGDYKVALTVSETSNPDNKKTAAPQTFTVIAKPSDIQTASFTVSSPPHYRGETVTLDASASRLTGATDSTGLDFAWTLEFNFEGASQPIEGTGGGNTAIQNYIIPKNNPLGGTYTAMLTVSKHTDPSDKVILTPQTFSAINKAPVISSVTADPSSIAAGRASTITAEASDDDSDTPLTYAWTVQKNTETATELPFTTNTATFTAPNDAKADDKYTISVIAKDGNDGESAPSTATITIEETPTNRAPKITALFPSIKTIAPGGSPVYLTVQGTDEDNDAVSYAWTVQKNDETAVDAASSNGLLTLTAGTDQAIFSAPSNAEDGDEYTISVTADDRKGGVSAPSTATITIEIPNNNEAPKIHSVSAVPGFNFPINSGGDRKIKLTAVAEDTESDPITYNWVFKKGDNDITATTLEAVNGGSKNAAAVYFVVPNDAKAGDKYTISVTADDQKGGVSAATESEVTITAAVLRAVITANGPHQFLASGSTAEAGTLTYSWSAQNIATNAEVDTGIAEIFSPQLEAPGKYLLKLTVTDNLNSHSVYHPFTYGPPSNANAAPIVSDIISVDPTGLQSSTTQYLMVIASDPDGDRIHSAEWSVTPNTCGTFSDSGKYHDSLFAELTTGTNADAIDCAVTVTVSDGYGAEGSTNGSKTFNKTLAVAADIAVETLNFSYLDANDAVIGRFTLPAKVSSYTVPSYVLDNSGTPVQATKLQVHSTQWICDSGICNTDRTFIYSWQTLIINNDSFGVPDGDITLNIMPTNNDAVAILSKEDLAKMDVYNQTYHDYDENENNNSKREFYQLNSIDLGGKLHHPSERATTLPSKRGTVWNTIGTLGSTGNDAFHQTYNGQHLPIRNMFKQQEDSAQNTVGLFPQIDPKSSALKNVALQGFHIKQKLQTTSGAVGGLVGEGGYIENSYAIGSINSNAAHIGGLLGKATRGADSFRITKSYARGVIERSVQNSVGLKGVGGLVGLVSAFGTKDDLKNSYARVMIRADGEKVGGLIGDAQNVTLYNNYSTSRIIGNSGYGLFGNLSGPAVIGDSNDTGYHYWDTGTSDRNSSTPSTSHANYDLLQGQATDAMKNEVNYGISWDFVNTWKIDSNINDGYPHLRALH